MSSTKVSIEPASATLAGSLFQVGTEWCTVEYFSRFMQALFSLNLSRCEARVLPSAGVIQRSSVVMATSRWLSYRGVPDVAVRAVLRGFIVLGLSSAGWCCIPHAVLGRISIGWLGSGQVIYKVVRCLLVRSCEISKLKDLSSEFSNDFAIAILFSLQWDK